MGNACRTYNHSWGKIDCQIADFVMDKGEQLLKEAGAIKIWRGGNGKGGVGDHQNGTCRRAAIENVGRDRYCQSHDVDNLFVTDGSVLVTDGGFILTYHPGRGILARNTSRNSGKDRLGATEKRG